MDQTDAWNEFYRSNGRAWRGNTRLPDPLGGSGRALDIGCGSGKSASTLIGLGYDVTGIDTSSEAVSICEERFGDSASFLCGSVLDIPVPESSFDYVVAVHVLEHVADDDMARAASEIRRVLKPGGWLFIRDFAPGDMREERRSGSVIEYNHRLPEEIAGFFDGFKVVSAQKVEERTRFGTIRMRSELRLLAVPPAS